MKFLLSTSAIILFIGLSFLEGGLTSCSKDNTIYDTVTVIQTDTITIKDTVFTEAILTSHPWKIKELRGVNEGSILYYLRGGSANTQNFDNEFFVFNADHTGMEDNGGGFTFEVSNWQLTNSDSGPTKLTFNYKITPAITAIITWDNIHYKNNSFYYDEYYTDNNTNKDFHGQGIRIPK